jgi:uncharacterized protein (DUF427 family)
MFDAFTFGERDIGSKRPSEMKPPSAGHPIAISKLSTRLVVRFKGVIVAQSDNALKLDQTGYPAVFYVPRSEIYGLHFRRTDHSTYCPYKGRASFFSLVAFDQTNENAVWTYEDPHPALVEIKNHVAFYADKVTFELDPL